MNVTNWLTGRFAGSVSTQMVVAVNAVKKHGDRGYMGVAADPETGLEQVVMVRRRNGQLQQVRMPAVDQLVLMTGDEPWEVLHFLADETHCAYRATVLNTVDCPF